MTRTSLPQRRGDYRQPKPFWLFTVLHSLALIATAYLVAICTYLVILHVSELPHGPLWDDSFRAPLAFVLVVAAATVMLTPYFQKEWDTGMRVFSILSAVFLLAFASLSSTHIFDPKMPLVLLGTYVLEPLRHVLKF
ncbi:MAG: hypothetical protein NVSMB19_09210 [Vulcanimicrobiaceae bacterium]